MKDVICIGSATLDIFVKSPEFKVIPSNDGVVLCEKYGGKLEVDELTITSGGGATNSATTFVKQNLEVGLIAEIGEDLPGHSILQDLNKFKINTNWIIQEPDERTAVSIILVSNEGGRSIVTYRGASKMLGSNDIPWNNLDTKWFYITSIGGNMKLLEEITQFAHNHNIAIAINPGSSELRQKEYIYKLAPYWHVLIINEQEASELTNTPVDDLDILAQNVQIFGSANTLLTAGSKGAYLLNNETRLHCEASPNKAVEVTGAGDAFGSGFVSGLIWGYDLEKSLQLAAYNAGNVIKYVGAKAGIISRQEFESGEKQTITNW